MPHTHLLFVFNYTIIEYDTGNEKKIYERTMCTGISCQFI